MGTASLRTRTVTAEHARHGQHPLGDVRRRSTPAAGSCRVSTDRPADLHEWPVIDRVGQVVRALRQRAGPPRRPGPPRASGASTARRRSTPWRPFEPDALEQDGVGTVGHGCVSSSGGRQPRTMASDMRATRQLARTSCTRTISDAARDAQRRGRERALQPVVGRQRRAPVRWSTCDSLPGAAAGRGPRAWPRSRSRSRFCVGRLAKADARVHDDRPARTAQGDGPVECARKVSATTWPRPVPPALVRVAGRASGRRAHRAAPARPRDGSVAGDATTSLSRSAPASKRRGCDLAPCGCPR